jgi:hypothetical protein
MHEVNAIPGEMIQGIQLVFPGTPIEPISPVRHQALQPLEVSPLLPADAGHLVGPPRTAQPCPQIIKHFIRNVNPKWFHNTFLCVCWAFW